MTIPEEAADLRVRVNSLEHSIADNVRRLAALELWQRQTEITAARTDEKWINVDKRFDDLDKKIAKVSDVLTRIMWIFVSAIILAFVAFIVKGGLSV